MKHEKAVGPTTFPDVPHAQVVQEVQRLALQSEADKAFFDGTYDQINDHADKLEKVKDAVHEHKLTVRKHIERLDKTAAALEKVAGDVTANDAQVKQILQNNDAQVKGILQHNDDELKNKLRQLETIITEQGRRLEQLEAVRPSTATTTPVGAQTAPVGAPVGDMQTQAMMREIPMIKSKIDALEGRATAYRGPPDRARQDGE